MEVAINNKEVKVKAYPPKLTIYREDYLRLIAYAFEAKGEISGFMKVTQHDDGQGFHIHAPVIFEQECTGVTTDLDTTSVAKFFDDIVRVQNGDPTEYRCWWHSHVDMDVFYSGTDNKSIDEFTEDWGFAIGITVNRKGEIYTRIQYNNPLWIEIENVPLMIKETLADSILDTIKQEVSTLVKEKTYTSISTPTKYKSNYSSDGYPTSYDQTEPYKSGILHNGIWRHEKCGKAWDYDSKSWRFERGRAGLDCEGCDKLFYKLRYNSTVDGFLCKNCYKDAEAMDWHNLDIPSIDVEAYKRLKDNVPKRIPTDVTPIG